MPGTRMRSNGSSQYIADLEEKRMFDADPSERHRLSRIFRGRLVELQFASNLEHQSHVIVGLEAHGAGPDIETINKGSRSGRKGHDHYPFGTPGASRTQAEFRAFAKAVELSGKQGTVELVTLMGDYTLNCSTLRTSIFPQTGRRSCRPGSIRATPLIWTLPAPSHFS